jgi:enoyl-CoA hydratase/carnithine racemase
MLLNRAEALARQIAANAPLALKFCIDAVNRGFTEEAVLFGKFAVLKT